MPASTVIGELDLCGAGSRQLILDCCFSGGFVEEKGELDLAAAPWPRRARTAPSASGAEPR